MTATFETHATASHRYYMRKTKAEIVQRIRDMLTGIPDKMVDQLPRETMLQEAVRRILVLLKSESWFAVDERTVYKYALASAAMLAHELLGKVQAMPELTSCAADCDDMCDHPKCPQNRDGEPAKTGRHCPLYDPAWRDGDE